MQYLRVSAGENRRRFCVSKQSQEKYMQFLIAIELALMLVLALRANICNIEREFKRKPIRYDDTDGAT
jgi:hypothetical protein